MKGTNAIGLAKEKTKEIAEKLNELLANYSIFYQNTRGYHWNIKGDTFFVMHPKFEELYNDLKIKIDEVAERVLTLGHTPDHNFSMYAKASDISESGKVANGNNAVKEILEAFKILITRQREILDMSAEINDEGTNAMMSDYIREQEKMVWMYSAYLDQ